MILSVPLTMVVKIALEVSEDTIWIVILLGPNSIDPATAGQPEIKG
jgi:hypothetical protein